VPLKESSSSSGCRVGRVLSFERTREMAEIYGLYTTRNGLVRYVGQSGDRAQRLKEHQRGSLFRWFHHEWRQGYLVQCALLEVCDDDDRHSVEQKWIWHFPSKPHSAAAVAAPVLEDAEITTVGRLRGRGLGRLGEVSGQLKRRGEGGRQCGQRPAASGRAGWTRWRSLQCSNGSCG
jgi:hypothetical protein